GIAIESEDSRGGVRPRFRGLAACLRARSQPAWTPRDLPRSGGCSIPAATATTAISTAAPAATATATAVAAATAAGAGFAGLGFVHGQIPAAMLTAVESLDGRLRLGVGVHLDKPEPLRPVRVPVDDDLGTLHRPERRKQGLEVGLSHVVGQVAYVQL